MKLQYLIYMKEIVCEIQLSGAEHIVSLHIITIVMNLNISRSDLHIVVCDTRDKHMVVVCL